MKINKLIISFLLALSTQAYSSTNSEKYKDFDSSSKERENFVLSQNRLTNLKLKQSQNRESIQSFLKSQMNTEEILGYRQFKDGYLKLVDRGLNQAQEIVSHRDNKVVFTNTEFFRNNRLRIVSFLLNPSHNKLLIVFKKDGSTDDYSFLVHNLATDQRIVQLTKCKCRPNNFFWFSDTIYVYGDSNRKNSSFVKIVSLSDTTVVTEDIQSDLYFQTSYDDVVILTSQDESRSLILKRNIGAATQTTSLSDFDVVGLDESYLYAVTPVNSFVETPLLNEELSKVHLKTGEITKVKSLPVNISEKFELRNGLGFIQTYGFERKLNYLRYNEPDKILTWDIPNFVTVANMLEAEDPQKLKIVLKSDLKASMEISWDLIQNKIESPTPIDKLALESPSISLDVDFKLIPSFDGTLLPIRIVSKRGAVLQNSPVYMEVYGGFGVSGYLDPNYDSLIVEFIRRGGIYVAPGLRGGNEFGTKWHKAAQRQDKYKTYEDLAATAKYLIDQNISSKEKIVIAGTSNGGLTVAATGLLHPQYFGLVIPINGVLDLIGKEHLDQEFHGWSYEYGNAEAPEAAEYLQKWSPLEIINKPDAAPDFLVVNGRKDTRVNSAHSFKFVKAAADLKAEGRKLNVNLVSINNSGHGIEAKDNDYISLRALQIKWVFIYDKLGLKF